MGKSTLLNAALDQPLAIVSPTPQTTRDALLGVIHHGDAEIALLDTPGLHKPVTQLGRVMNRTAREAAREADVVVFVTDLPPPKKGAAPVGRERPLTPHPGDLTLLADIGRDAKALLVVNKVDRVKEKARLLPLLEALAKVRDFAAIIPVCALKADGVKRVLDEVAKLLPEGAWRYGEDELTDRPVRFFAAEYVREQILRATREEVPHAAAVSIDAFVEPGPGRRVARIDATIHVERDGQKKILIGAGGEMLKRIGTAARQRIEALTGQPANLKLWVRVTPDWRQESSMLEELGYGGERSAAVASEPGAADFEAGLADGGDAPGGAGEPEEQ